MKTNRKIDIDIDKLLLNTTSQIDIGLFPSILLNHRLDKNNYKLAQLLISLKSFNEQITQAQNNLKISKLISTPKKPTRENISKILSSFGNKEQRKKLKDSTLNIIGRYKLNYSWIESVKFLIITNLLLIPPKDEGIHIHIPPNNCEDKKDLKKTYTRIATNKKQWSKLIIYPSIYFTKYVSPRQFKDWSIKNAGLLKIIQTNNLKSAVKIDQKTLFWGQMASVLRQEGVSSWTKMVKIMDDYIQLHGSDIEKDDDFTENIPNPSELQKYCKQYLKHLKKIEMTE